MEHMFIELTLALFGPHNIQFLSSHLHRLLNAKFTLVYYQRLRSALSSVVALVQLQCVFGSPRQDDSLEANYCCWTGACGDPCT
jgi:hypothetical protein